MTASPAGWRAGSLGGRGRGRTLQLLRKGGTGQSREEAAWSRAQKKRNDKTSASASASASAVRCRAESQGGWLVVFVLVLVPLDSVGRSFPHSGGVAWALFTSPPWLSPANPRHTSKTLSLAQQPPP